ncbi:MAG: FAD-dependent oxidoreductase [Christensenellaceae bacterium]|jgi:NAD(P)H-nitrite reductase large subunit|nr:FAD-dependent oxidoreductase [Christensenellaceae bacterium]
MRYLIIGNSAAAIGAVEGIREIDKVGSICLISDEMYHTYSRPLISYYLQGKTDKDKMKYRDSDFYEKNSCQPMLGDTAVKIDHKKGNVILESKNKVAYDKLLIATGSRAFIPPIDGLKNVKKKFTFMKFDDVLALEKELTQDSRVLIMGAGLIGLKCAEGIYGRVKSIDVVDLAPRILSSILDDEGAQIIKNRICDKINFKLGAKVDKFNHNLAYLSDGTIQEFDILIIAVGVRPNIEIFANCGGVVDKGIVTNEKQETSITNIYAAGDVCESYDSSCDSRRILAILPNAYAQGRVAGINMAGGSISNKDSLPINALGLFGTHMVTAGSYAGDSFADTKHGYKRLFIKDGILRGYIIIDHIDKAGIYTALIRDKAPLSSDDFNLIRVSPSLAAFSDAYRLRILSGSDNNI